MPPDFVTLVRNCLFFKNYAIIPYSFIAKSYSIDKNLSIKFL